MKTIVLGAVGCASLLLLAAFAHERMESGGGSAGARSAAVTPAVVRTQVTAGAPSVELTLSTPPIVADIQRGDGFVVAMSGTWRTTTSAPVYLQASDSAGTFAAPQPAPGSTRLRRYYIVMRLPASTAVGVYAGLLTVRACADALCQQPYPDTMRSISYTVKVKAVGEWGTLQRTARHDGYVPVDVEPSQYRLAWTWQPPSAKPLSAVVTDGRNVYFSERNSSPSLYALRAVDGVPQWRRVFGAANALNPPSVSNGIVYAATTGHSETWLYALRGSDGIQSYQSQFSTQWASILNPTVHNGRVYVNSGYYGGVVYSFNLADGVRVWEKSAGTYGMNTPAVDDEFAYVYNGTTLSVMNVLDGSSSASIGPEPYGIQTDYNGTPMLGSVDHVLTYGSATYSYGDGPQRQLVDFSVAGRSARWMSFSLYSNYPAVAKGVVYATSNESHRFDALDEATGQVKWAWAPPEQGAVFIGNVLVTNNAAFVSTKTRLYAIDLRTRRTIWSAPTPGMISMSADRMLFVSKVVDYGGGTGIITAYRLE